MTTRRNRVLGLFDAGNASMRPSKSTDDEIETDALSVTDVVTRATGAVRTVGRVRLIGEVSSIHKGGNGTWHFSLQDTATTQNNVLAAVMFQSRNARVRFDVDVGVEVIATGSLSVYGPQSKLQIIVETLEHSGQGRLAQKYEEMRSRFEQEGLFDQAKKQSLPLFPSCVGVVTSRNGAAVHDVIKVLRERHSGARILLSPTRVQGQGASREIAAALQRLDATGLCDVIIVGRGGGAYEDLWSFNMEVVVRAIAGCRAPVISSVGHQSDVTLADHVADQRAATPSHAAELCTAHQRALRDRLLRLQQRAEVAMDRAMEFETRRTAALEDALIAATVSKLEQSETKLRQIASRLISPQHRLMVLQRALDGAHRRLLAQSPQAALVAAATAVQAAQLGLARGVIARRDAAAQQLGGAARRLHDLSPLAVLDRGYALCSKDDAVVQGVDDVAVGDALSIRLADGTVQATAKAVLPMANQISK